MAVPLAFSGTIISWDGKQPHNRAAPAFCRGLCLRALASRIFAILAVVALGTGTSALAQLAPGTPQIWIDPDSGPRLMIPLVRPAPPSASIPSWMKDMAETVGMCAALRQKAGVPPKNDSIIAAAIEACHQFNFAVLSTTATTAQIREDAIEVLRSIQATSYAVGALHPVVQSDLRALVITEAADTCLGWLKLAQSQPLSVAPRGASQALLACGRLDELIHSQGANRADVDGALIDVFNRPDPWLDTP